VTWLYSIPFAPIAATVIACVLGALECGHRLSRGYPVDDRQVSTIAGPILGLVALLLAFSFSMAGDRHALRRAAIVQEANSIGTFWLRTSLMPEPIGSEMRSRLRRYVDLHSEHRGAKIEGARTAELEEEAARLQAELWALLIEDAQREPEAGRLRLVTPALNAMIDDAATVLAAKENRVPDAIFLYLFLLVVVAGIVVGYRPRDEVRNLVLWSILTVVLSGVLVILLDMDRPRRGLIQTDMSPYARLRRSME